MFYQLLLTFQQSSFFDQRKILHIFQTRLFTILMNFCIISLLIKQLRMGFEIVINLFVKRGTQLQWRNPTYDLNLNNA